MLAFLSPILSFLGGPVIQGLVNAYKARLASVNTTEAHAIDLAKADLMAQIEARKDATALAGTPVARFVQLGFAIPPMLYSAKIIIWDTMLGWGTTPAIHGDVAVWCNLIISFFFGGQIVSGVVGGISRIFRK
jgi:hypothetical protein